MRDFENLKQKFGDLYLTCFDADPQTLYTVTQYPLLQSIRKTLNIYLVNRVKYSFKI